MTRIRLRSADPASGRARLAGRLAGLVVAGGILVSASSARAELPNITVDITLKGNLVVDDPALGGCGASYAWPRDPMVACGYKWTGATVIAETGAPGAVVRGLVTIRGGTQFGGTCTAGGDCWETNFCDGGACCRNFVAFDDPRYNPLANPCPGGCDYCRPDSASTVVGTLEASDGECMLRPSSYVCRGVAGVCDVAETCPGAWTRLDPLPQESACPADGYQPAATVCRAEAAGGCDAADTCSGTAAACPDVFKAPATVCRGSSGACDPAEVCSGAGATCPVNRYAAAGTTCDWSGAACSGAAPACPVNTLPAGATMFSNKCGF